MRNPRFKAADNILYMFQLTNTLVNMLAFCLLKILLFNLEIYFHYELECQL